MMADTDTYEKIAATYATELREIADRLEEFRRRIARLGMDPQTWPEALGLVDLAVFGIREKARGLDDLPAIAELWIDTDQED